MQSSLQDKRQYVTEIKLVENKGCVVEKWYTLYEYVHSALNGRVISVKEIARTRSKNDAEKQRQMYIACCPIQQRIDTSNLYKKILPQREPTVLEIISAFKKFFEKHLGISPEEFEAALVEARTPKVFAKNIKLLENPPGELKGFRSVGPDGKETTK